MLDKFSRLKMANNWLFLESQVRTKYTPLFNYSPIVQIFMIEADLSCLIVLLDLKSKHLTSLNYVLTL